MYILYSSEYTNTVFQSNFWEIVFWWNYNFNVDDEALKNCALNIANELDNQNQTQMGFDSKTSRQNFPTLPRNYFSSSYEHGCAMQEIMSSLQVSIEFIIVDIISKYLHKLKI